MFSKVKKYIIGFFGLFGGLLFAFLSGKGAGKKLQKIKDVKDKIKEVDKEIKNVKKDQKQLKKTLKSKKSALKEIKKQKKDFKVKKVDADDAVDFLKKYTKKKK